MRLGGFSLQRYVGISAAKSKLSRAVGWPLFSRSGREAWIGRKVTKSFARGRRS